VPQSRAARGGEETLSSVGGAWHVSEPDDGRPAPIVLLRRNAGVADSTPPSKKSASDDPVTTKTREPPDAAGVVLTFLESVGRRSEAELYVRLFRELPKESFAIIVVESAVVRYAAGSLVEQLRFLRELGLFVPVAVGVFEPATGAKAAQRLAKRSAEMGAVVEDVLAPDLTSGVRRELAEENLPIISFANVQSEDARTRWDRLGTLAGDLRTRKIVVLRRRGGLRRLGKATSLAAIGAERVLSVINLRTDTSLLTEPRALSHDDVELLQHLGAILGRDDCKGVVASITSPLNLLRELFTVKGAGTLVKRGSAIERHDSYSTVDVPRLRALLESSFGRALDPAFFDRPPLAVYVEENYRGAAIVASAPIAPYLTKFAVDRVAQGEGIARDLWDSLTRDHTSMFWRARVGNPIVTWYVGLCDGMMRVGDWTVYFRGIGPSEVPRVVDDALRREDDFLPAPRPIEQP
jgi:acetylglutamate kinase